MYLTSLTVFTECLFLFTNFSGSITNPQFGRVSVQDISPVSTTSPDPESTSFCPFDEEQLPQELADAMYDPRMFFSKEVYFDPDIIGKWGVQYCNDPKFSDTQVRENSVDLDQTASEEQSNQGLHFFISGERGGSVVECWTPEREVGGSKLTAAVLCPWARHFTPRKYWLITQEAVALSRHDWKIVDWALSLNTNKQNFFISPASFWCITLL